ncbi:hypothetical protein CRG98_004792 [Punica granatum]|uniref:Uncharacterized protein n=1 Tax=Punica granatum TaxID=22663 RepID=A0A2I0L241_PUNGR|nr:hypothetical protein CRG98_004792 [Punica granatum]
MASQRNERSTSGSRVGPSKHRLGKDCKVFAINVITFDEFREVVMLGRLCDSENRHFPPSQSQAKRSEGSWANAHVASSDRGRASLPPQGRRGAMQATHHPFFAVASKFIERWVWLKAALDTDSRLSLEEWSAMDAWKEMSSHRANASIPSNAPIAAPSAPFMKPSRQREECESSVVGQKKKKARTEVVSPVQVDVSKNSNTLSRGQRTGIASRDLSCLAPHVCCMQILHGRYEAMNGLPRDVTKLKKANDNKDRLAKEAESSHQAIELELGQLKKRIAELEG